ncbi:MAG: flagellar hook capping FlgD N-terminal domain-containing protein [Bacillota bacterium]
MAVDYVNRNVWPNYSKGNVSKAGTDDGQTLGKDQFLSILITQLRYQDPLQPMEDKEFIAQMAQFTSLEQLMNISSQLTDMRQSLGAVSSLIGKKVSWIEYAEGDSGQTVVKSGVVDSVLIRDGIQFVRIGKDEVALEYIMQIENNVPEPESPETENPETGETPEIEPEAPSTEPEAPSTEPDAPAESSEPSQQSGEESEGATP